MIFTLWRERATRGTQFRAGGWADQPAATLIQLQFMDLIETTWRYYRAKDADWAKLTSLQRDLIKWLDGDDGPQEERPKDEDFDANGSEDNRFG